MDARRDVIYEMYRDGLITYAFAQELLSMPDGGCRSMERTLVLLKPDALKRGLREELLKRLKKIGYIVQTRMFTMTRDLVERHYAHVKHLDVFPAIVDFMVSGPVVAVEMAGEDVIKKVRAEMGPFTDPPKGTIRGDYDTKGFVNLLHASDSAETAEAELARFGF